MSTCGTVKIEDEYGCAFYLARGHDGTPGRIVQEIDRAIVEVTKTARYADDPLDRIFRGRWHGSEIGLFVPLVFAVLFDIADRLPDYELLTDWRGDESYRLGLRWQDGRWCWTDP